MRILYLCADPGVPVLGRKGCSTHVRETARALGRAGHEVLIACASRGEDAAGSEELRIAEVPRYTTKKLGFDLRHILFNRRFDKALGRIVNDFKPEAIYERFSLYSFSGKRLAERTRLPRILEINAFLSKEQEGRIHFSRLARWCDRRIASSPDRVIVVTEILRDKVAQLGVPRANIHNMHIAVDTGHFTPEKSGDEIRKRHGLNGKFVIGYAGALTKRQGIDLLFEVDAILKGKLDNYIFFIVGGTPVHVEEYRKKAAQSGVESRFSIVGSVPYAEVPEHLRAMDIAVIPDTDSSPAKLFEYQSAGLAIVAPSYPFTTESAVDGRESLFFEPRNPEQFAEKILTLSRDLELKKQIATNARQRALKDHSIESHARRIIEMFESIENREAK
jgi:glycosyltransferase involved in cell wall biosynthesis